jgi:hypothetical protein
MSFSMNWVTQVKGACHLDYTICGSEDVLLEVRQHILIVCLVNK